MVPVRVVAPVIDSCGEFWHHDGTVIPCSSREKIQLTNIQRIMDRYSIYLASRRCNREERPSRNPKPCKERS